MEKRRGPIIDPCGTPRGTSMKDEHLSFAKTACERPSKYDNTRFAAEFEKPN